MWTRRCCRTLSEESAASASRRPTMKESGFSEEISRSQIRLVLTQKTSSPGLVNLAFK